VSDLPSVVAAMKDRGLQFRSDIVAGPGGKQIQLLDPDGNPVELFEPASRPWTSLSRLGAGTGGCPAVDTPESPKTFATPGKILVVAGYARIGLGFACLH
jgi:hypothetical protein